MYEKYVQILFLQYKTYITKPGATKLYGDNYLGYLLHPPNNYLRGGLWSDLVLTVISTE